MSLAQGAAIAPKKAMFHRLMEFGLAIKVGQALLELGAGIALLFFGRGAHLYLEALAARRLIERPNDFIASHLLSLTHSLPVGAESAFALYLAAHGLGKAVVLSSLMRGKRWAYPAGILLLGGFVAYQLFKYVQTHEILLIVVSALDVFLMGLIGYEWRTLPPLVKE